jgi:hypothetical protein
MSEQEQKLADVILESTSKAVESALAKNAESQLAKENEALKKQAEAFETKLEELASQVSQSKTELEILQKTTSSMDAKHNISSKSGDIDNSKINKVKALIVKEGLLSSANKSQVNLIDVVKNTFKDYNDQEVDFVTQSISTGIISDKNYQVPNINIPSLEVFAQQETFVSGLVNREINTEAKPEFTARGTMSESLIDDGDNPTVIAEGGTGNYSSFGSSVTFSQNSDLIAVNHIISNIVTWSGMADIEFAKFYNKMVKQIEINRSKAILNGYKYQLQNGKSVLIPSNSAVGIEGIFALANNPVNPTSNFSRYIEKISLGNISGSSVSIGFNDLDTLVDLYPSDDTPDIVIADSVLKSLKRQANDIKDLVFNQYFNNGYFLAANGKECRIIVVPCYNSEQKTIVDANNNVALSKRIPLLKQKGFENYIGFAPGQTTLIDSGFNNGGPVSSEGGKIVAMACNLRQAYTLYTSSWIDFQKSSPFDTANTGRTKAIMTTAHAGVVTDFTKIAIGYARVS